MSNASFGKVEQSLVLAYYKILRKNPRYFPREAKQHRKRILKHYISYLSMKQNGIGNGPSFLLSLSSSHVI